MTLFLLFLLPLCVVFALTRSRRSGSAAAAAAAANIALSGNNEDLEDLEDLEMGNRYDIDDSPLQPQVQRVTIQPKLAVHTREAIQQKLGKASYDLAKYYHRGTYFIEHPTTGKFEQLGNTGHGKNTLSRIIAVMTAAQRSLSRNGIAMTRAIMYEYEWLFSKTDYSSQITHALYRLEYHLDAPMRAFRIDVETKGKLDGLYRVEGPEGQSIDCQDDFQRLQNPHGWDVPNWYPYNELQIEALPHDLTLVSAALCVIIVEDGYLFHLFRDRKIWTIIPCILVCSHGQPDKDTRAHVHMLTQSLNIPAYGLSDLGVGGINVLYGFSGITERRENDREKNLFKTSVQHLGLRRHQLKDLGVNDESKLKIDSTASNDWGVARIKNHIDGASAWISDGLPQNQARRLTELKETQDFGYKVHTSQIDPETLFNYFVKLMKNTLAGDYDKTQYAYAV